MNIPEDVKSAAEAVIADAMAKLDMKALESAKNHKKLIHDTYVDAIARAILTDREARKENSRQADHKAYIRGECCKADFDAVHLAAPSPSLRETEGEKESREYPAINRMLLSQVLQSAFFAGRGTSGIVSPEDMEAWQDYDPTKLEAYKRLRSTLEASDTSALLLEAEKALEAFADIAGEAWADETGWTDAACQNDRIVDWFGPSAFRAARYTLAKIRGSK